MKHKINRVVNVTLNAAEVTVKFLIGVRGNENTGPTERVETFTGKTKTEATQKGHDYIKKHPRRFFIDILPGFIFWLFANLFSALAWCASIPLFWVLGLVYIYMYGIPFYGPVETLFTTGDAPTKINI